MEDKQVERGLYRRAVVNSGHADQREEYVPVTTSEIPRYLYAPAHEILQNLITAAELFEQREIETRGEVWNSDAAKGLRDARDHGWIKSPVPLPKPAPVMQQTPFAEALEQLLNDHSREQDSNTPDFLLSEFLQGCLTLWNRTVIERDKWRGIPE